jgi:hypothetical protein
MESEKKAVRDFECPTFLHLDAGIEESKLEAGYHSSSTSQENQRIETPEPNLSDGNGAMSP